MTHLRIRLNHAKNNVLDIGKFALYPLTYWSQQRDDTKSVSNRQKALSYLIFPLYLLATIGTLVLGVFAVGIQVTLLPFQSLYAYMKDVFGIKMMTDPSPKDDMAQSERDSEQRNKRNVVAIKDGSLLEQCSSKGLATTESDRPMIIKPWDEILEYGRFAPSPHNMQPWLFQIESQDTATLMYDPQRLLPGTNPTGTFMNVSFGILNETLSIAAAPLGLDVEVTYNNVTLNPEMKGPQPLATLKLVQRQLPETLDRKLIIDRRTSRLPYNGKPVSPEVLTELSAIAEHYGHKLEFSSDPSQVDWVVRLNADTMFFDMSKTVARNEVSSWMRFSRADAMKRADGLAAYAMHVPGMMMWLFVHANWAFRLPGIYQLVRAVYERGMRGTATVAWISGPFETPAQCDNAGHMMARLWLTMTKYGVYLHPFGSVITKHAYDRSLQK